MSIFDLFRGFFGVPGGHFHDHRDPFFDAMTHEDDDDDDEDCFCHDGLRGDQHEPHDGNLRFGFSFGPDGMRFHEPPMFGQVFKEMEEIFSQFGGLDGQSEHFGVPSIPSIMPPQEGPDGGGSSGNPLRDFMLKEPGSPQGSRTPPSSEPGGFHSSPPHRWRPFSRFNNSLRPRNVPDEERKEDRDLDADVSSRGLDQILTQPPPQPPVQPRSRSFFQSVTVSKVVKPDGSVEERRTVRDGQGNEETTVTRSGPAGNPEGAKPQGGEITPGGRLSPADMRDDDSLFTKFFGGFK